MPHLRRRGASRAFSLGATVAIAASALLLSPSSSAVASSDNSGNFTGRRWLAQSLTGHDASSDAQLLPAPRHGHGGARIKVVGFNFGPNEYVQISFVDSGTGRTFLGTFTTNADGMCFGTVTIPADATVGRQKIKALGTTSRIRASGAFRVK